MLIHIYQSIWVEIQNMEHSSLRCAEYTQHTEDTTYYLFIYLFILLT